MAKVYSGSTPRMMAHRRSGASTSCSVSERVRRSAPVGHVPLLASLSLLLPLYALNLSFTRGFLPSEDGAEIINQAREIILRTIEQSTQEEKTDWSVIKEKVRQDLKRFLNKQTAKRPLILPVILEV